MDASHDFREDDISDGPADVFYRSKTHIVKVSPRKSHRKSFRDQKDTNRPNNEGSIFTNQNKNQATSYMNNLTHTPLNIADIANTKTLNNKGV